MAEAPKKDPFESRRVLVARDRTVLEKRLESMPQDTEDPLTVLIRYSLNIHDMLTESLEKIRAIADEAVKDITGNTLDGPGTSIPIE